ncbi:MAG: hypothetical protein HXX08_22755 [Chloroflexi bacterium]|uniref:Uncharacterized protein n=1 Tax=Candidatus Chlorohelix allophototropha TaxID=3003348 RepID=A0A8T7M9G8_9CHLR|nr:hypothetical protein [Chloroflexota bacterium]WJW68622.1 hypothetical protein OZ401_004236 [Chloroflexota bacterium L227-S17]
MKSEFDHILTHSSDPQSSMREKVRELLSKGHKKEEILEELELLRADLQSRNMEQEEDIVLEIMDYLVGWCSPHMKL